MADDTRPDDEDLEYEVEVVEDVEWLVDEDGAEYFIADGVRHEMGDDGYAYPVEEAAETAWPEVDEESADDTDEVDTHEADTPSPFSREGEQISPPRSTEWEYDETTQMKRIGGDGSDTAPLLELHGVRSGYGSLPVLHGVEMAIRPGETCVLLGLNGAGKTTTAMNVCGALKTWDGTITFDGADITGYSTTKAVRAGIVMVPEGRRVFPDLSVEKNLQMGAWSRRREHGWLEEQRERVYDYFPRLRERSSQLAGTLSGGEQQMLAIGRGLMASPKLLIIDEASMGLAPVIVKDVFEIVSHINADGTTVLMIEQNVGALEVADVAYVMEQGRMLKELRGDALHDPNQVSEVLMG